MVSDIYSQLLSYLRRIAYLQRIFRRDNTIFSSSTLTIRGPGAEMELLGRHRPQKPNCDLKNNYCLSIVWGPHHVFSFSLLTEHVYKSMTNESNRSTEALLGCASLNGLALRHPNSACVSAIIYYAEDSFLLSHRINAHCLVL